MLSFTCTATNPNLDLRQPLHVPCVQDFHGGESSSHLSPCLECHFFLSPFLSQAFNVRFSSSTLILIPAAASTARSALVPSSISLLLPLIHTCGALPLLNDSQHVPLPAMCIPSPLLPLSTLSLTDQSHPHLDLIPRLFALSSNMRRLAYSVQS